MMLVRTYIAPSEIQGLGIFAGEFIPGGSQLWVLLECGLDSLCMAIIVARLENGERCWAMTGKDPDLFEAMEKEEFIGKKGRVMPGGDAPNIMTF